MYLKYLKKNKAFSYIEIVLSISIFVFVLPILFTTLYINNKSNINIFNNYNRTKSFEKAFDLIDYQLTIADDYTLLNGTPRSRGDFDGLKFTDGGDNNILFLNNYKRDPEKGYILVDNVWYYDTYMKTLYQMYRENYNFEAKDMELFDKAYVSYRKYGDMIVMKIVDKEYGKIYERAFQAKK